MCNRFSATVLIACVFVSTVTLSAVGQRRRAPSKTTTQLKNPAVPDVAPTRSQELWVNIFPVGMQIFGLHRDVRDPSTIFARTHRGLYKTSNGGMYWAPLFVRGMTQSLTFAQSVSSPNIMYLGTSDTDPWATDIFVPKPPGRSMDFGSLWRSDNGGETWQDVNANKIIRGGISQVAADPRDPNVVYAVSGSLFKSLNGGRTWADIGPGGGNFFLNPWRPDNLILCGSGCIESIDGGLTWREGPYPARIYSRSGSPEDTAQNWFSFFFHPTNKSIRLALVGEALVISRDDGQLWIDISIPEEKGNITCWDFSRESDQVIYAGTRSALYISKNLGRTWQKSLSQPLLDITAGGANEIYAATPFGIFKSPDGGSSWHQAGLGVPTPIVIQDFSGPKRLLALLEFIDVMSDTIYVGSDRGGYLTSEDGGLSWSHHSVEHVSNDVTDIFVTRDRTTYLRAANRAGELESRGSTGFVSGNGGILKISPNGSSSLLKSGLWRWADFVALSSSDSRKLYLVTTPTYKESAKQLVPDLLMSDDAGFSWLIIDLKPWLRPLIAGHEISKIPIIAVSPQSFDAAYLVGDVELPYPQKTQVVLTTRDGGRTWRDVFPALEISMRRAQPFGELPPIASLVIDPKDSRVVYVMTDTRVFRSEDGGLIWSRLPTGQLQTPFKDLAISPSESNVIYLASDHVVFRSTDSGKTWSFSNRGFAGDSIWRLMASSGLVLAQGHNGIYRMSDDQLSWAVDGWRQMEKGKTSLNELVASPPQKESTPEPSTEPTRTPTPASQSEEEIKAELAAIEERFLEAQRTGDKTALSNILADNFTLSRDGSSSEFTKAEYLSRVKAQKNIKRFFFLNLNLSFEGPVAVLSGLAVITLRQWGVDLMPAREQFTDKFVRRDGRWQIVARSWAQAVR